MSGKSPLEATAEQREDLELQARVSDREEADRARGILLSLSGWTSIEIGEALRVREDTGLTRKKWNTIHHWKPALQSFQLMFGEDRMPIKAM